MKMHPRSFSSLILALFCMATAGNLPASPSVWPAVRPTISLYAEAYDTIDRHKKDIDVALLTLEAGLRPRNPNLGAFEVGALTSIYRTHGTLRSDTAPEGSPAEAVGVGAGLFLRLHALETTNWSVFVDASASMAFFDGEFPPGGTRTNGAPRFGLGVKGNLSPDWSLIAGARWMHISNGQTQSNPGYDANGGYLGMSYRFGGKSDLDPKRPLKLETIPPRDRRTALLYSYHPMSIDAASRFALHSVESDFEWRLRKLPWLGLTTAFSVHRASGELKDPNHGLGLINPGSTGFGWQAGLRPSWEISDGIELYAEASYGGSRFNRNWPFTSGSGRFSQPWDWAVTLRGGAGARWHMTDRWSLVTGWRHLSIDSSDERPDDAPDFRSNGFALGVQQRF